MINDKHLLFFGGIVDALKPLNSVHILDTKAMRWQQDPLVPSEVPTLYAHSANEIVDNDILIFGGMTTLNKASNRAFRMNVTMET
jgi:hypothetical protein